MFPCCDLCYRQYLNKDGSVDEAALQAAIEEYKAAHNGQEPAHCTCDCHVKGSTVMH